MRTLKIIFSSLIFMSFNMGLAFSDITQSAPTNLISSIATATSFTSLEQITPEAQIEIQNTTSSIVDSGALQEEVQESAEAFGVMLNETGVEIMEDKKEKKLVLLNGTEKKNEYEDLDNLEPTLNTIVYDTGMVNMTRESGHYDTDNKTPGGENLKIFDSSTGAQQARVKVFVDFNRKVLFGSVESKITLNDGTQMTNTYNGKSSAIDKNTLPVDKRLTFTMSSSTGNPLDLYLPGEGPGPCDDISITCPSVDNLLQPFDNDKQTAFRNSLLNESGNVQTFELPSFDEEDMVKSVSHGSGGDKDVLVQARFSTSGSDGTPGQSVASFEASNMDKCAGICTKDEMAIFADSIERYTTGVVTTTATKFTGELPQ